MNEMDTRFANQFNIQWFPGHMTKTLRMMEQEIQHVDASLVLLDARIPLSSLNPEIERITARKPKLYALNKADLADPAVTEEWIRYFRAADAGCVAISAKQKGGTTAVKSVARIKDELLRLGRLKAEKAAASSRTTAESIIVPGTAAPVDVSQLKGSNKHTDSGIIVEGLGNCLVKFAKCCTPVPGDPVIGFITRGYGVSVHRADCPNAAPENRKPEEAARWVRVSWVDSKLPNYRTALEVASKDRDNLTLDVAMALSAAKVKVTALSARSMPDGHAILRIEVEVRDKEELASVINKLNNIQGVYHVARLTGK